MAATTTFTATCFPPCRARSRVVNLVLVWEAAGGASMCELCTEPWLTCKNMFLLQTGSNDGALSSTLKGGSVVVP